MWSDVAVENPSETLNSGAVAAPTEFAVIQVLGHILTEAQPIGGIHVSSPVAEVLFFLLSLEGRQ